MGDFSSNVGAERTTYIYVYSSVRKRNALYQIPGFGNPKEGSPPGDPMRMRKTE